jgi:hypothetical protein
MPNAQLAATERAYHAVSVWRHFCTARVGLIPTDRKQLNERIFVGHFASAV